MTYNKEITQSLWIAVIATVIDQVYHIIREYPHQIFDIANRETFYYIGLKFLFVFVISIIILNIFDSKNIIKTSVIIGVISAFLFSIVITQIFPYIYGIDIHMLHALGIGIAVWFVLNKIK